MESDPTLGRKRVIFSVLAPCEHLGRRGPPRSRAERGSWLLSPSGAVNEDCLAVPTSQGGLSAISASLLGVVLPPPPHSHPCLHPGRWPPAEGGGKGGRLAGLGAMAKPQSLLGPGEKGHVDARSGTPALSCSCPGPGGQDGSTGARRPELESGLLSPVLHPQQATSLPRAPSSPL